MKAYSVTLLTWPGLVLIYGAETRAQAIFKCYSSATDAGYDVKWTDFRARRCPMYDEAAIEQGKLNPRDYQAKVSLAAYGR